MYSYGFLLCFQSSNRLHLSYFSFYGDSKRCQLSFAGACIKILPFSNQEEQLTRHSYYINKYCGKYFQTWKVKMLILLCRDIGNFFLVHHLKKWHYLKSWLLVIHKRKVRWLMHLLLNLSIFLARIHAWKCLRSDGHWIMKNKQQQPMLTTHSHLYYTTNMKLW